MGWPMGLGPGFVHTHFTPQIYTRALNKNTFRVVILLPERYLYLEKLNLNLSSETTKETEKRMGWHMYASNRSHDWLSKSVLRYQQLFVCKFQQIPKVMLRKAWVGTCYSARTNKI